MEGHGIIATIVIGFVIGVLAKLLHPGRENMGFIMTTLLGIAGSFAAGFVMNLVQPGAAAGWIASTVGAIVILIIYGKIKGTPGGQ